MLIKAGVTIQHLTREARRGLGIVSKTFPNELVVTSTNEGNHSAGSLHYANAAFDVRPPDSVVHSAGIVGELKVALGKDFDVIHEGNHIHIEYDP